MPLCAEQKERFGRPLRPSYQINWDCTYLCNTNTYHPLHPPQLRILVTMPKGARGLAFKAPKLENLANIVEEIVPISHTDWDRVRDQHNESYREQNWTTESLMRKFQWMAKLKMPTGDPNMPRHIRVARRVNYAIVKATDGSMGLPVCDNDDDDDEEDEDEVAEGNSQGDGSDEEDNVALGDTGVGVVDPTNLFDSDDEFGDDVDGGGGVAITATAARATASTAASSVTTRVRGGTASVSGGKRSGTTTAGGGRRKKAAHLNSHCRSLEGHHPLMQVMMLKEETAGPLEIWCT